MNLSSELFVMLSFPGVPQRCRFPQEVGPCRALHQRYSFNMTTMQCDSFKYGGCRGNANNFQNLAFCNEYCSPHQSESSLWSDYNQLLSYFVCNRLSLSLL